MNKLNAHPSDYPTDMTGGYPFLNIATFCGVPYASVLQYADECAAVYRPYAMTGGSHKGKVGWPESTKLNGSVCAVIQDRTVIEEDRKAGRTHA